MQNNVRSSYIENNFEPVFRDLIYKHNPSFVIEFGILDGYSLELFAKYCKSNCKIMGFDLFEDYEFNNSNRDLINKKFVKYQNVIIKKANFYTAHTNFYFETIDLLHVDISNTGETYKFCFENYFDKIKPGGAIVLEGGSKERDEVEWMNRYEKSKIMPEIEKMIESGKCDYKLVQNFPSISIFTKK